MMFGKKMSLALIALVVSSAFGGDFLQPVQGRDLKSSPQVIVKSGSGTDKGRVVSTEGEGLYLTSLTVEVENGDKKEFTSQNRVIIKADVQRMLETSMVGGSGVSSKASSRTTGRTLLQGDQTVWRSIVTPDGDYVITQLLNPGFANVYEIYSATPEATIKDAVKYIAIRDGKSFYITKKGYRTRDFEELFGDSPSFMKKYENRKIEWWDFPEHLQLFDHYAKDGK